MVVTPRNEATVQPGSYTPVFPIISSFNAFPARDYTPVYRRPRSAPDGHERERRGVDGVKLEVARVVGSGGGGGIGRRRGRTIRCLFPRLCAGQSN